MAGLGKPPYAYRGCGENIYIAAPGAPSQPGGTCDYCGNGIMMEFYFKSSDGKRFKVGSDCVRKADDKGLVDLIKRDKAKIETEKRNARETARIEREEPIFRQIIEQFASEPHPHPYHAEQGKTKKDYYEYLWERAWQSGKIKLLRQIVSKGGK